MCLSWKSVQLCTLFCAYSALDLSLWFARNEGSYALQVAQTQNLDVSYVNTNYMPLTNGDITGMLDVLVIVCTNRVLSKAS